MLAGMQDHLQAPVTHLAIVALAKVCLPMYYRFMSDIGDYLKQLRTDRKLTLRGAAEAARLSNAYLSQIETGKRGVPSAKLLQSLAQVYGVPPSDLLREAGYLGQVDDVSEEEAVNRAFEFVMADKRFQAGTRVKGGLDMEAKRYIVEVYERVTGAKLLGLK